MKNPLYIYAIIAVLGLISIQLPAQQNSNGQAIVKLQGVVTDSLGRQLQGATVSLSSPQKPSFAKSQVSGKAGNFIFQVTAGNFYIDVFFEGYGHYKSNVFNVSGDKENITMPLIILQQQAKMLKDVTVTAAKKELEVSSGKFILNVEQSASVSGTSAFELLQRTPGIAVDQNENLLLRGSAAVNVMLDGKMTYLSAQQLGNMLKSMPAENITRIEVITTPSAKYDASGNTGIINIITKKSNKQGYAANLSTGLGVGHYLLNTETFTGNIKTGKLNLFGNLGYDFRHSYTTKASRQIVNGDSIAVYDKHIIDLIQSYYYSYKVGLDVYISKKQQAGFVCTGSIDDWSRDAAGPTYLLEKNGQTNATVQNHTVAKEPYYNNIYNINYQLTPDTTGKTITVDADYILYRNNSDGYIANGMFDKYGFALHPYQQLLYHQPSNIDIRSIKTDLEYPVAGLELKAGLKYSSVTSKNNFRYDSLINNIYIFSPSLSDTFIYKEKIAAAYLSVARRLKNTSVELGMRVEHTFSDGNSITTGTETKATYTNLFPSVAIDQKLNGNNKLSLSISHRINRPSYANLNPVRFFSDKYSYYQGNPYLKPEKSWVVSLSYTFLDKYIATLNYNRTTDFIAQGARLDSSGILVSNISNYTNSGVMYLMLAVPFKIRAFWNISTITDVAYNYYPIIQLASVQNVSKLSVNVRVNQTYNIPTFGVFDLTASYNSPTLNGVYLTRYYLSVDGGFKKSLIKNKLDLKISFADIFHTSRYWGYSINNTVGYNYNFIKDSRRARLTLTYHIGGKLSSGKLHKTEEENRL